MVLSFLTLPSFCRTSDRSCHFVDAADSLYIFESRLTLWTVGLGECSVLCWALLSNNLPTTYLCWADMQNKQNLPLCWSYMKNVLYFKRTRQRYTSKTWNMLDERAVLFLCLFYLAIFCQFLWPQFDTSVALKHIHMSESCPKDCSTKHILHKSFHRQPECYSKTVQYTNSI